MKKLSFLLIFITTLIQCKKDNSTTDPSVCNIENARAVNATKVTITNGIWGTVSSMEGNCMPPTNPTYCKHCPVKRTIQVYQYTLQNQATPYGNSGVFFDSFSTALVAQTTADDDGFFQMNLPAGHYTIAIIENGKLYANGSDGFGGITAFTHTSGTQMLNLTMTYKAAF
ncbi:MAG: hypothetical protein KGZ59_05245 [Chitinophagaceae bacterium]|nr:hypothetical protein [Chitinophagaceae bacterium]MBS4043202.1 hypothetical protein [Chitinophagaceae bacterium]